MDAPTPPMSDRPTNTGSASAQPNTSVLQPLISRPVMRTGRRPTASTMRPVNCCPMTLPIANRVSANPAMGAPRVGMAPAMSGTSAIRTPKVDQPLANPDASSAR